MILKTSLLSFFAFVVLNAQNEMPNREPFTLKLAIDNEYFYEEEILKTPYFEKKYILRIYPSEHINIEVEFLNNSIYSMKVVKENLYPEKTIEISFEQIQNGRLNETMQFHIKNPFDNVFTYKVLMVVFGSDELILTRVLPVSPKSKNIEFWESVIISLILADWKIEVD
jgi:hypothetical protein